MTTGQLYLVTEGAQRGLRIEPFVQLRSSPATAQFTCYFYNRLEGEEARLVSYHLGSDSELRERSPSLWTLVAGFDSS
jgi:type I restriction enzyme M protein